MNKPDTMLFLGDHRGIYIPQHFAECIVKEAVSGVTNEQWEVLEAGPDHELYWDVWTEVCDQAKVTDPSNGVVYFIHQNGDCWLVPEGMEWDEATESYNWPEEEEEKFTRQEDTRSANHIDGYDRDDLGESPDY